MPEPIVTFNEESLKGDLRELVRKTVEDTLNGLLEEEAGDLVGAERYERTADREAYRAGHHDRSLTTSSGEVTLHMPKLKGARFTTAIIERYRRRETGVEEAMIEMYLAGVSTRRIEDVSEILRGSSVSAATVSNLNEKAFSSVEEWRNRPLERACPYVYVDGIYLKRSWGGSYENVAVMVAIGVNDDGYREVIGAAEGFTESTECWREFLSWLKSRGLRSVRMFAGDKAAGMVGSVAEVFPGAAYQRCTVHFYRNVLARVPKSKRPRVAAMLKAVHAMESREAAEAKALEVASELERSKLKEAAGVVLGGYAETLTYTRFPREHWRRIRTNNAIERLNREIRRRTRVVGTFPDGRSAPMLVTARLKYVAESEWGSRRYLDVTLLDEWRAGAGLSGCRKVRKNLDGTDTRCLPQNPRAPFTRQRSAHIGELSGAASPVARSKPPPYAARGRRGTPFPFPHRSREQQGAQAHLAELAAFHRTDHVLARTGNAPAQRAVTGKAMNVPVDPYLIERLARKHPKGCSVFFCWGRRTDIHPRPFHFDDNGGQSALVLTLGDQHDIGTATSRLAVRKGEAVSRHTVDKPQEQHVVAVLACQIEIAWRLGENLAHARFQPRCITSRQGAMQFPQTSRSASQRFRPLGKLLAVQPCDLSIGYAQFARCHIVVCPARVVSRQIARKVQLAPYGRRVSVKAGEHRCQVERLPHRATGGKFAQLLRLAVARQSK